MLPTPIKTAAIDFSQSHVAVFPCLGDDGKLPLVTWGHLKRPPKPETIDKWWAKWPDANVGIATEPSRLTVVDCDDASVVKTMLRECGDTPLIAETPRDGVHLYYRHNGERSLNGFRRAVDVKAAGGFIVAPPSRRPDSGKTYTFVKGSLTDFARLPTAKPGSLPLAGQKYLSEEKVPQGARNVALFRELRKIAPECETLDELLFRAEGFNEVLFDQPLTESEVRRCAEGVWKYLLQGRCFQPGQQYAGLSGEEIDTLIDKSAALALWVNLKRHHKGLREEFVICPAAMAPRLNWSEGKISRAINVLIERNFIIRIYKGGRGRGDPHKYAFALRQARLDSCPISDPLLQGERV